MVTRSLVVSVVLGASGAAIASPRDDLEAARQSQLDAIARAFGLGGGDVDAMNRLARDAEVACGRDPALDLHAVAFVHERCTTTIATADAQVCRGAGVLALLYERMWQLAISVDDSFAYEVTCQGHTLTGEVMARKGGYPDGELNMKQVRTSDGAAIGAWSSKLPWDVQAPDASQPYFWAQALVHKLPLVYQEVNRLIDYIEHDDPQAAVEVDFLVLEIERASDAIRDAPAVSTDGGLQATMLAYLADLKLAAEKGDLKRLVDRTTEPPARRKLRKRKKLKGADGVATATLLARAQKTLERKEEALAAAIDAFNAPYEKE